MNSQSRNELADKLHAMGDAAYCRASNLAKRELCLGEEFKIKTGVFTHSNLKALEEVRAEFGRANGLWEAEKLLRETPSETAFTVPAAVKMAITILLKHIEPGWENSKAIVEHWLKHPEEWADALKNAAPQAGAGSGTPANSVGPDAAAAPSTRTETAPMMEHPNDQLPHPRDD